MKARYRWNLLKSISVKINNDKVQCLVCNKFFSALAPHLSKTHGKTTEWYRTKYDNAPTVSESYRSGLSNTKREQSAAFTPEQRKAWGDRISKQMHAYFDRMTPEEYETYVEQQVAAMTSPDARVNGLRAFKARATKEEWAAHRKNLSEKTKAWFARMSEEEIREFIRVHTEEPYEPAGNLRS